MAVGAVLLAELPRPVDEAQLDRLRRELVSDMRFGREDFSVDGPLRAVPSRVDGPIPTSGSDRSFWLNANLWRDFYSEGYPRGDIEMLVRCAEWLENHLPGSRVWYGHDGDDHNIAPFPPERRQELIEHAKGR